MGKKVYAIQAGFDAENNKKIENVIVNTWNECLRYVKGVKGAKYKSFEDINDANAYLNEGKRMLKKSEHDYPKDCLHIYVDGSYNAFNERYSYGLAAVRDNVVEYVESGDGSVDEDQAEKNIRQVAGELRGAIRAVEYAVDKGEKKIVLFHDYEGIANHATGTWARNGASSIEYYEKMQNLMGKGIEVIFVKVDSHTGDLFNELVDEKCKECLNIDSDKTVEKWLKNDKIIVLNEDVKKSILSIAPGGGNNIIIKGQECDIVNECGCAESAEVQDENAGFKELTQLYMEDTKAAKKKISKLLSKQKEKYILYLLDSMQVK